MRRENWFGAGIIFLIQDNNFGTTVAKSSCELLQICQSGGGSSKAKKFVSHSPVNLSGIKPVSPSVNPILRRRLNMGIIRKTALAGVVAASSLMAASSAWAADIVDTAVSNGSFKTLVAAVQAAGLVDTLKGPGSLHRLRADR